MMQLRFSAGAEGWEKRLCEGMSAQIKVLGLKSMDPKRQIAHFVDITTTGDDGTEAVKGWLEASGDVHGTDLTELGKGRIMGVIMTSGCRVCGSLIDSNLASLVSSAATESDCTMSYKLYLNSEGVPKLLNKLSSGGVGYKVTEISQVAEDRGLTTRQLDVLKSAIEQGLYDYPRRITQEELAVKLGIKSSTLNEILRRAEKKILGTFLGEADGQKRAAGTAGFQ